ncbi:MAG: hypothetical protein EX262_02570 [Sphingomonadaceae bacterium]|nr:MAG: hypothetical protein EX262_02570 [Sphingomonadaceae bacterium]
MRLLFLFLTLLLTSACSTITPATMRLPGDLALNSERLTYAGIGGGTRGRFQVGAFRGSFERSEQRLAIFDALVRNYGRADFVIEGPAIGSTIEAQCRMRERLIDLGIAEFKASRMAYRCEFTAAGHAFPARFEVQEVSRGLGGTLSKKERRGEIALGGETVQIRSVHKLDGSPIEMASPIGYVFTQNGDPVGAVELNGAPELFIAHGIDHGLARTVTIAATALAIFWDPANSALGDD